MLKKKIPGRPNNTTETIIGVGACFEGNIKSACDILIDGEFTGKVESEKSVVINTGAKVNGEVKSKFLVVHGSVEGNVIVDGRLDIGPTGKIKGDVRAGSARVSEGGCIDGVCSIVPFNLAAQEV